MIPGSTHNGPAIDPREGLLQVSWTKWIATPVLRLISVAIAALAVTFAGGVGAAAAESAACASFTGQFQSGPSFSGTSQASGFLAGEMISFVVHSTQGSPSYELDNSSNSAIYRAPNGSASSSYTFPSDYPGQVHVYVTQSGGYDLSWSCAAVPPGTISYGPANPSNATDGVAYSQSVATASNGSGPYTYSLAGGSLPQGISLSSSGTLSGTASAVGDFPFTVKVTDTTGSTATASLQLTVAAPSITVSPTLLPNGEYGTYYDQAITASGGTAPYTYRAVGLPGGLVLASSGALTGNPSAAGTFSFSISATDSSTGPGAPFEASQPYTLTINASAPDAPTIGTATPGDQQAKVTFTPPASTGGAQISTYTVTSSNGGNVAGCSASPCTVLGLANGTAYTFTVTATNSAGRTSAPSAASNSVTPKGSQTITFNAPASVNFGTSPQLDATSNSGLQVNFSSATTPVCTVTSTGVLTTVAPGMCTIDTSQGGSGAWNAAAPVEKSFQIVVPGGAVSLATPSPLPAATAESGYSQSIAASGGASPYSFQLDGGALPPGVTLSTDGTLSGTTIVNGTFHFTVRVTDAATQTATKAYVLQVDAPTVSITPNSLPASVAGATYPNATLQGDGGVGPYSFAVTTGSLPAGLTLTPQGLLSGTATTAGTDNFTVTATDANGFAGAQAYSVSINSADSSTTVSINPSPSVYGQAVTLKATVAPQAPAMATPTGAVTFSVGASTIGTAQLNGGVATLDTSALPIGPDTVTAVYAGTTNTHASQGSAQTTVSAGNTTTTLTTTPDPSVAGQTVTLTAKVAAAAPATGTPTGTVDFFDGATSLGAGTLSSGVASFAVTSLSQGAHQLTARYEGDAGFGASSSAAVQQQVNTPPDSLKLRAMQILATQLEAQASGAAFSQTIEDAVYDGFSDGNKLLIHPGQIQFNYASDAPQPGGNVPWPDKRPSQPAAGSTNVWGRLQGTGIGQWSANAIGTPDVSGMQVNAYGGIGYHTGADTLVGLLGGYEAFNYTSTSLGGKLSGQGGTIGVYGGAGFGESGHVFGGLGYSEIEYNASAGTASGQFDGHRWLFSGGIDGDLAADDFRFTPSLTVFALTEKQDQYTDSLGTVQGARSTLTGNVSGGIKVAYPINYNGAKILPSAGLYADYTTQGVNSDLAAVGGINADQLASLLDSGLTARATAGASVDMDDGTSFGFNGEYGGIGGMTQSWGLNLQLGKRF